MDCRPGWECQSGICCRRPEPGACADGSSALRDPEVCRSDADCSRKVANFVCDSSRCCPRPSVACPDGTPPMANTRCQRDSSCPQGYFCHTSASVCCAQQQCADGLRALTLPSRCSPFGEQCPSGYVCVNSVCCLDYSRSTDSPRLCPDGSKPAVDPPFVSCSLFDQACPQGFICLDGICCGDRGQFASTHATRRPTQPTRAPTISTKKMVPITTRAPRQPAMRCPNNGRVLGQCGGQTEYDGQTCPSGSDCIDSVCCAIEYTPAPVQQRVCPDRSRPLDSPAACFEDRTCPESYFCANRVCCRDNTYVPMTRPPQKLCNDGATALAQPRSCTAKSDCPFGYECESLVCCPQATTTPVPQPQASGYGNTRPMTRQPAQVPNDYQTTFQAYNTPIAQPYSSSPAQPPTYTEAPQYQPSPQPQNTPAPYAATTRLPNRPPPTEVYNGQQATSYSNNQDGQSISYGPLTTRVPPSYESQSSVCGDGSAPLGGSCSTDAECPRAYRCYRRSVCCRSSSPPTPSQVSVQRIV